LAEKYSEECLGEALRHNKFDELVKYHPRFEAHRSKLSAEFDQLSEFLFGHFQGIALLSRTEVLAKLKTYNPALRSLLMEWYNDKEKATQQNISDLATVKNAARRLERKRLRLLQQAMEPTTADTVE